MILLIDNYDSFTYNLYQYLGEFGVEIHVVRNDQITIDHIKELNPSAIVISPGPKTPTDAGECINIIKEFYKTIPILGICLGHQCIGYAFGGIVKKAPQLYHGKQSNVEHNGDSIFKDIPNNFMAARYHSLIVDVSTLPKELDILAETEDGVLMALKHKEFPLYGLQFHPESIYTVEGKRILYNFITMTKSKSNI